MEPSGFKAFVLVAHAFMDEAKYDAAIHSFEKAIPLSNDGRNKAIAFSNIGVCYGRKGDFDEAKIH